MSYFPAPASVSQASSPGGLIIEEGGGKFEVEESAQAQQGKQESTCSNKNKIRADYSSRDTHDRLVAALQAYSKQEGEKDKN